MNLPWVRNGKGGGGRKGGGGGEMGRERRTDKKKHVSTCYLHVHPHAQASIVLYKQTHMHKLV